MNITNRKDIYILPELWKKLGGHFKGVKYSAFKNDIFALGMLVLEAGIRRSVQDLYLLNGGFDWDKLLVYLSEFTDKFAY